MPENAFSNYFPPSRSSSHTHIRGCAHTPRPPTGARQSTGRSADPLPVNDGPILKAAAACHTAPSGAENQDNFIVIISLLLSPSLSLVEGMKTQRFNAWLAAEDLHLLCLYWTYSGFCCCGDFDEFLDFMLSPESQSHLIFAAPRLLIVPEIRFQLIRSGFLKQEL